MSHQSKGKGPRKAGFSNQKQRMTDASNQESFIFNKTPILASALKKLKSKNTPSLPKVAKRPNTIDVEEQERKVNKKIKRNPEDIGSSLSYTPLQRDLYNFFTINKTALKNFDSVPEPKFEVGSTILTALCDRGIGGKFLVGSLFRNKKCYIDYKEVSLTKSNEKKCMETLEKYDEAGSFVVGTVVKGRAANHIQFSMSEFVSIEEGRIRVGQTFPAQIKSKEELGCHLIVYGLQKYKVFLPKAVVDEEEYEELEEDKQLIVSVDKVEEGKKILKVVLASSDQTVPMNFKGLEEEDLSKIDLDQYVTPGTLLNTKIIQVLSNGVMVKFLKIFIGFIHADHLKNSLESYAVGQKLEARVIFYCINPPTLYLSQRHVDLSPYEPERELYSEVEKPRQLTQVQKAYMSRQDEFFVHPSQLHSDIKGINKFWVKENNYFEKYQIMTSKKIGIQVGQISKVIPFTNFKLYGQKEGKEEGHRFRVMCLDVWNKVIKISYDVKILKAPSDSLLKNPEDVDSDKKYIGFIMSINPNGVVIEFCNNIKGIISQNQLKLSQIEITEANIGEGFEAYVFKVKKGYLGLTLRPPAMRREGGDNKTNTRIKQKQVSDEGESVEMGTIQSVNTKSIFPIYVKLKNRMAKISVFKGVRPPSIQNSHIIENLPDNFKIGDKVKIFRKGKQFFLYPPEQLHDKELRFCRIIAVNGSSLRVQTSQDEFKSCHITNVTDIVSPYPLTEYKVGEYTIGRLIGEDQICLRKSIVQQGVPKSMQDCLKRSKEQQSNGDYRNRLLTIGCAALKNEMVCFGYIKNYSQNGCFISLSHDYEVRVDRQELSDGYVKSPEQHFKANRIVLCRLINSKTKSNDPNKIMFDASLRESIIKHGYPITDEVLEHGVGLTVEGSVKGYAKGKALVQLNACKFTGIISLHEVEGVKPDESIEKALPMGKVLKMKIIEYSLTDGKRLIRLSTLQKHFNKFKQFDTKFPQDDKVIKLWDHFKNLEAFEAPEPTQEIIVAEESEEDEEARILKMLGGDDQMEEQESNQNEQSSQSHGENMEMEEQAEGLNESKESSEDDQQMEQENRNEKANYGDEQFKKKTALFEKMPHEPSFYHSLVLANPTPESWLMYISSLLNTSTPAEVRTHFMKAINSFPSVHGKDNMWISWINMELILGDFQGTVKKAIESNVGMNVYFRILEIITEKQQWQIAIEFGRKMLKKFNREIKAYIQFLKMVTQYTLHNQPSNESIAPKQILRRASQCLKSHEVITLESHMARNMFEVNQAENGRNIFEELLSKHPRRTDLWSMYADMEIKCKELNKARNLLERVLTLNLNKKQTKAILKKYYLIEQEHGTPESAAAVLERARSLAEQFEEKQEMSEQNDSQND